MKRNGHRTMIKIRGLLEKMASLCILDVYICFLYLAHAALLFLHTFFSSPFSFFAFGSCRFFVRICLMGLFFLPVCRSYCHRSCDFASIEFLMCLASENVHGCARARACVTATQLIDMQQFCSGAKNECHFSHCANKSDVEIRHV